MNYLGDRRFRRIHKSTFEVVVKGAYTTGQKYGDTPEKSVFSLFLGTSVYHTEKFACEKSITVFYMSGWAIYFRPAPGFIFMEQTNFCVLRNFAHFWPNFYHISCPVSQTSARLVMTAG